MGMMKRNFTKAQRLQLLRKAGYRCQICGTKLTVDNWEADHIIPYSRGGKTENWNGQALCSTCNRQKGNR